jgi:hypothetical protein
MPAHDWLEVSALGGALLALALALPEPELAEPLLGAAALVVLVAVVGVLVPEVRVVGVVLVVAVGVALGVVVAAVIRARAGSWPEIRSIAISSQVATNRASALATTRRRMPEIRAMRARRTAIPRARRSDGEGVMSVPLATW